MLSRTVVVRSFLAAVVAISCIPALSCSRKEAALPKQQLMTYVGRGGIVDADKEVSQSPWADRRIIRHATMELLVDDIAQAVGKIRTSVNASGGFVEKSSQSNFNSGGASITARVPAERLDQTMAEIKGVATRVEQEHVEAKDVTREYVDLDARLRNTQAEEAQYLQILKRASTVKDTLEVSEKLSNVRGRIEQLQGETKYMTTQIAMSTVDISLHSEAEATVMGIRWRPLRRAKTAFVDMVSGLADWVDAVVAFLINLPLIAVWFATVLALIVIVWRVLRFSWRKLAPSTGWKFPFRGKPSGQVASD